MYKYTNIQFYKDYIIELKGFYKIYITALNFYIFYKVI